MYVYILKNTILENIHYRRIIPVNKNDFIVHVFKSTRFFNQTFNIFFQISFLRALTLSQNKRIKSAQFFCFLFFFYKLCFVRVIIGSSGPGEKPTVCHLNICLSILYLTFNGKFVNITVTVSNKSNYNFNNNENEVNWYIKTQSACQKYGILCWSINTRYIYIYKGIILSKKSSQVISF